MYQVESLQSLMTKELSELNALKLSAEAKKAKLEALKAKGDKNWTEKNQEELQEAVLFLVDVEEAIDEKMKASVEESKLAAEEKANVSPAAEAEEKPNYTPAAGTEGMVHLSVVQGRRFNPTTGKEESKPVVRLFTFSEYQLFKKHHASLGYTIVEELHNPYKKVTTKN